MTDASNRPPDELSISRADLVQVEQALQLRLSYRVRALRLELEPHGLVLTGHACSYYDKQLAQTLVKELGNLIVAENRIAVDLPPPSSHPDPNRRPEGYRSHRRKLGPPHATHGHEFAGAARLFLCPR
jgi:hypothetical protein